MKAKAITKCPICNENLEITALSCPKCGIKIQGNFVFDKFSYLSEEQKYFIEVFIKCRGNIKDVEKELDISYPTVRGRLDDVIRSLGYTVSNNDNTSKSRKTVLDMLERGEITSEEAVKMLKE